jgi:hypothetical protein
MTPYLGLLVNEIEIKEEPKSRSGLDSEADFAGGAWLEASFIKAFEGMPQVQKISITRCNPGELLSARIMTSAAFKSATTLELSSGDNIDYSALRNLHLSPSLRTLDIKTPMRYQAGTPSGMFEPCMSGIEKLAMSAEPHSAGECSLMTARGAAADLLHRRFRGFLRAPSSSRAGPAQWNDRRPSSL